MKCVNCETNLNWKDNVLVLRNGISIGVICPVCDLFITLFTLDQILEKRKND